MNVVLVTNELWPFVTGGGIGRYVAEAASVLAEHDVDVTIVTSDRFKDEHAALAAREDPSLGPSSIRWAWAEEPTGDLSPFWSWQHAWSYSCHRALAELGLGRALVEFEDYGGAAMVTLDAARAGHPALAQATLAVRTHTAWEMTQALDERPLDAVGQRAVMAMERHGLRFADLLLSPAQLTLDAYRRFYGTRSLAPAAIAPVALRLPEPSAGDDAAPDGPL